MKLDHNRLQALLDEFGAQLKADEQPRIVWDSEPESLPLVELRFLEASGLIDYATEDGTTVAQLTPTGRAVLAQAHSNP